MKAVVLAGGLGTRLRPYTFTVPKPLLPVGDKALLEHLLDHLRRFEVSEVILSVGYQAQLVRAYFGDGSRYGVPIQYVQEDVPLGTAGCIALARPLLDASEPFLLMNGDIITRLDFDALRRGHEEAGAHLTVAYIDHVQQSPFGVLELDGREIVGVVEKPTLVQPVSAGIYCVSPQAAALVPDGAPLTMPELMLAARAAGLRVCAHKIHEFWRALETRDHIEALLNDDAAGAAGAGQAGGRA